MRRNPPMPLWRSRSELGFENLRLFTAVWETPATSPANFEEFRVRLSLWELRSDKASASSKMSTSSEDASSEQWWLLVAATNVDIITSKLKAAVTSQSFPEHRVIVTE
ncbi:MAG: hypothetical protein P8J27_17105 [Mariniblastus sp.]|nr:hypothetical protein [Mariniblastus sp.]